MAITFFTTSSIYVFLEIATLNEEGANLEDQKCDDISKECLIAYC